MSISLKNHEDRIKVLENKAVTSGKLIIKDLWSGNVESIGSIMNLNEADTNYQLIGVLTLNNHYGYTKSRIWGINHVIERKGVFCDCWGRDFWIQRVSATQYKIVDRNAGDGSDRFTRIFGLKIYYIFRYNICEILKLISPILKF